MNQDDPLFLRPQHEFEVQGVGAKAAPAPEARQIPLRGLGDGGNSAAGAKGGWMGTVHGLTEAQKKKNFRDSLDRQRLAAHPQAASVGGSIVDVTMENASRFSIPAPQRQKPLDRDGENEKRMTELEGRVAELMMSLRESQSPFRQVFLAERTGGGSNGAFWKEKTVQDADVVDFQDGRQCPSASSGGQLVMPKTAFAVMEIRTGSNTAYVPIGEGTRWFIASAPNGRGYYPNSLLVTPKTGDLDHTHDTHADYANIFDVSGNYKVTLINVPEAVDVSWPSLQVNAIVPATYWKTNASGERFYLVDWFSYALQRVHSDCPSVGSNGTSIEFPTVQAAVLFTATNATCVLPGTNCAGS